jgi:hypothetical protein
MTTDFSSSKSVIVLVAKICHFAPQKKKRKEASCHMVKETFENKIPIKSPHFEEKMNNAFTAPTFLLEKLSRFLAF